MRIVDSLLIRSGFEQEYAPDAAHLRSRRNGELVPVLPGTSLAGVLRNQALRILHTIYQDRKIADEQIGQLFGRMDNDHTKRDKNEKLKPIASRVIVSETPIENSKARIQSRVKIDRFTGGAFESALFAEQPEFGGEVTIKFAINKPQDHEIGLMLLVLKDLWTEHVAVGGGANVGRGRLRGCEATLKLDGEDGWEVTLHDGSLDLSTADETHIKPCIDVLYATEEE